MGHYLRALFLATLAAATFLIAGCGESDEMPESTAKVVTVHPTPSDTPTYEETMKYVVNIGDRAAAKPRQTSLKSLDYVEKEIEKTKPADMQKKLEQIAACRELVNSIEPKLRDRAFYNKYVQAKSSPQVSVKEVEEQLEAAKDKEFLRLRTLKLAAEKRFDDARAKVDSVAAEFVDKR